MFHRKCFVYFEIEFYGDGFEKTSQYLNIHFLNTFSFFFLKSVGMDVKINFVHFLKVVKQLQDIFDLIFKNSQNSKLTTKKETVLTTVSFCQHFKN